MLLVKKEQFELHAGRRLVKAEEAAAVLSAKGVIEAAEAEAKRIREAAVAAFEEEKRRGYEKGLADGKAEIARMKLGLAQETADYMQSVEAKMSDIVMKALKKCVAEIGDRELVVRIVRTLMNAVVRNQRRITLKVAPEMVEVVKARLTEILADYPVLEFADVQEDARLKGAAAVIETEAGVADASVETQLAAIEESFRKHFEKKN